MEIPDDRGDESFADDLNMWPGIVSGRVALLLRSAEIQPAAAPICPLISLRVGFLCFGGGLGARTTVVGSALWCKCPCSGVA